MPPIVDAFDNFSVRTAFSVYSGKSNYLIQVCETGRFSSPLTLFILIFKAANPFSGGLNVPVIKNKNCDLASSSKSRRTSHNH